MSESELPAVASRPERPPLLTWLLIARAFVVESVIAIAMWYGLYQAPDVVDYFDSMKASR